MKLNTAVLTLVAFMAVSAAAQAQIIYQNSFLSPPNTANNYGNPSGFTETFSGAGSSSGGSELRPVSGNGATGQDTTPGAQYVNLTTFPDHAAGPAVPTSLIFTTTASVGNFVSGQTYTLSDLVGSNNPSHNPQLVLQLIDFTTSTVLSSVVDTTPISGAFKTDSLTYVATNNDAIGIGFGLAGDSNSSIFGYNGEFENLKLSTSTGAAVPEPSTSELLLAGSVMAVVVAFRRRLT